MYVPVERSRYTGAPKPPRTTAGSATPLAACRRIPTTAPPPRFSIRVEGKMGGKVGTVYDRPIIGLVPVKGMFLILFTLRGHLCGRRGWGFFNGAESIIVWKFLYFYFSYYLFIMFFIYHVLCYYEIYCIRIWNFFFFSFRNRKFFW